MSSSRFKTYLLENLLHPINIDSSSRENHSIYFHLHAKERHYSTLLSAFSSANTNSHISTTLDYLVFTSSHISMKSDVKKITKICNEKPLFLKTLTPSTLESIIFNSVFTKDHASFMTIRFKSSLILF